ncbi:hypothetical protein QG37_06405 [Candidozyma auris]|nr:hypothetical protein QG37_06405 [[Candida] auris]
MRAPYNNTELATELFISLKHKNLKRVFDFFFFFKKKETSGHSLPHIFTTTALDPFGCEEPS